MSQPQEKSIRTRSSQPEMGFVQTDELLTIVEVATYLKVSRRTAWRWCQSGRLPASKIGHQWRISRNNLQRFIDQQGNSKI